MARSAVHGKTGGVPMVWEARPVVAMLSRCREDWRLLLGSAAGSCQNLSAVGHGKIYLRKKINILQKLYYPSY
jgi:hypothetical protein